jgi:hypothetical protein
VKTRAAFGRREKQKRDRMATKADAWERTVDLVVRRVTYSAAAGACAAVVLFRTPGARQPRAARLRRLRAATEAARAWPQLRAPPRWLSVPAWVLAARSPVRLLRRPGAFLVAPLTRALFRPASEAAYLQKDVGAR